MTTVPLKRMATVRVSNVDKKSVDGEPPVRLCNYTDVYYRNEITPRQEFMTASASPAQISAFRLHRDDVIITKDSETAEDIGVPAYVRSTAPDLVCGYHLAMLRPQPRLLDGRFLYWFMSSMTARDQLAVAATGVTRFGLRADSTGSMLVPSWPVEQQRAIADYLDTETARIDALIEKKQRLSTSLEARFQARVSKALWETEGKTVRLKHLCGSPSSGNRDHQSFVEGDGVPCLRGLNIRAGRIQREELLYISENTHARQRATQLSAGDLVIVRSGLAGAAAVVPGDLAGANCVDLVVVRQSPQVLPTWLEYVINSREAQEQVVWRQAGAILTHFNAVDAGELWIPRVSISVQRTAAAVLNRARHNRDVILSRLDRQTQLLQEHRQALITAAVTGELDVSRAA